ncbi:MAG: hypothetical protein J0M05_06755 [Candidatus Kapabacteria bacterium]|jgi:hypothetical protein|nr:hypothetical protein [Ignavibacteria bacterium]MBN8573594.1 hypothetical protein [Candidatus Kapabacteria bacterium]HRI30633.1 hypothetical protein [Candidatus Kapabacteria bacterium]
MVKNGMLHLTDELQIHRDFTYSDFAKTNLAIFDINAHNNKIGDEYNIVHLKENILYGSLLCKLHLFFKNGYIHYVEITNPSYKSVLFELDSDVEFIDEKIFRIKCLDEISTIFNKTPPFLIDDIYISIDEDIHSGLVCFDFTFFDFIEYQKTGVRKPYTGRRL